MELDEDMRRVVREQSLGFVATVCPDGTPNLSPKGTTVVWDDEHLAFLHVCSPGFSTVRSNLPRHLAGVQREIDVDRRRRSCASGRPATASRAPARCSSRGVATSTTR